jgi:hypothetical protein
MLTRALLGSAVALGLLLPPHTVFSQEKKEQPMPPAKAKAGTDTRPAGRDDKQPGGVPAGEMTPEMKAAMEAMLPGPAHEKLAKLAGEWSTKSKLAVPGQPPEETEGTSRITVVMDGRFIHQEDSGTMMGTPFKSAKLMGFNNGSKKYEAVWTYTLGTNMMTMTGTSDDGGKTIKCGASFDNELGVKETLNVTYKLIDDDHFTIVLDGGQMPDGSPGPTMEMTYTRKK